jgi:7-keto-8-aminopelargonate synthetase-like enzyme
VSKPLSPTRADRLLRIIKRDATKLRAVGLSNVIIEDEEFHGESVIIEGRKLANFGLCSYLALGDDPRLKEAAKDAIDRWGTSYSSTPYYSSIPLYEELRELLVEVFDADVIVTASTTMGHLSALPVLIGSKDLVLIDSQAHTSMMIATQGSTASGVPVLPIPHSDMEMLERAIHHAEDVERIWYLTDGVYSMYGDVTRADELVELLERYPRLHVYCDDAHGFGWAGRHGRGKFLERAGWHDRVVVIVGLAKAFGSLGGAIATRDPELIDLIRLCGPGLMFGGPVPPPNLGASVAAARILLSDEIIERQTALLDRIRLVNRLSDEIGLALVSKDETPIWFHDVGGLDDMIRLLATMKERGFYMNGSAFPAVPYGHAGIRFTITLDNSREQIEDMLLALNETRLELFGDTEVVVDLEGEPAPTDKAK